MTRHSLLLIAIVAAACPAGVIVTGDGGRFEGDVQRADGGWKITAPGGKTTFVAASNVKSIELSGGSTSSNAAEGLQSLRRSVEASDDLQKIIDRYKKLIDQTTDTPTAAAAKQDVATWQDRLDRHLVKVGRQWVTTDEKAALAVAAAQAAEKARLLIKAGQAKEAGDLLDAAQQQDGANISVFYLQGVLAEGRGDAGASRKAFAVVQQSAPDHAPTLLNLAVLSMRQKQWGASAALMTQALLAAPNTISLIDAAAELLAAIPDEQRKSIAVVKLARVFAEQDQSLQKAMAAKKMYRWGSTWVDQPTMDKLAAADAAAKKKVQDLQTEFDAAQARIQRIDTESNDNARVMHEMESHSWTLMADGTYVRAPLPGQYYDLQQQQTKLHGERVELTSRLDTLRDSAKRAKNDFPVPKFTGRVEIIGEDGMPVIVPPPAAKTVPASQPATQPATTRSSVVAPPFIKIGPAGDAE